jgi:hypothetical protein
MVVVLPSVLIIAIIITAVATPVSIAINVTVASSLSFLLPLATYAMQYGCTNDAVSKYRHWTKSCLPACFTTLVDTSAGREKKEKHDLLDRPKQATHHFRFSWYCPAEVGAV